jgi:hypothetical protein
VDKDLWLAKNGDCTGTVTGDALGTTELHKFGDEVWGKPSAEVLELVHGKRGRDLHVWLDGRFMHGSVDDDGLRRMAETCDYDQFRALFDAYGPVPGREFAYSGDREVLGTPASVLTRTLDGGETSTIAVEAAGDNLPLLVAGPLDDTSAMIGLSDYDTPPPDTPDAASTIALADLPLSLDD